MLEVVRGGQSELNERWVPPATPEIDQALLDSIDLGLLLDRNSQSGVALNPERRAAYSLLPVRISDENFYNHGWAEGFYDVETVGGVVLPEIHRDGKFYKVYLNSRQGFILSYKVSPQAVVGLHLESASLHVHQIQGIRGYASIETYQRTHSRGLASLDWKRLLLDVSETLASTLGLQAVTVDPAERILGSAVNGSMDRERAEMVYDDTARRMGYGRDQHDRWSKTIL